MARERVGAGDGGGDLRRGVMVGTIASGASARAFAFSQLQSAATAALSERMAALAARGAPGDSWGVAGRRAAEITSNGAPSRGQNAVTVIFNDAAARLQDALP